MPVDKDMCRTVTVRFSLLNQEHVKLLEQMEQECMKGSKHLSKNKLIIRCIEEHYAMLASGNPEEALEERLKSYVDKEVQKIRQEIGKEIYQDVFRMFTGGLVAAGNQRMPAVTEIAVENSGGQRERAETGETDLSDNADIMDEVMKWS